MSLILKGIDLPEDGGTIVLKIKGSKIYQEYPSRYKFQPTRIKDAKAIQIPKEHGDIKDINTFLKDKSLCEYIENDVFNKKYGYWIGMGAIYNAPTILEAEGEE